MMEIWIYSLSFIEPLSKASLPAFMLSLIHILASVGETDRGRDSGNNRREEDVVAETSDRYLGCGTQL